MAIRPLKQIGRVTLIGIVLGTLILGIGGRIAMALIALQTTGRWGFTLGGTATVVFLGSASGLAGAALWLASRFLRARFAPRRRWLEHAVFGVLLLLVTMRGLRGSPASSGWYFYPLVVAFGVAHAWLAARALPDTRATSSASVP